MNNEKKERQAVKYEYICLYWVIDLASETQNMLNSFSQRGYRVHSIIMRHDKETFSFIFEREVTNNEQS